MRNKLLLVALLLAILTAAAWWLFRERPESLDPPDVLKERILSGAPAEVQAKAARDMIRHGEPARPLVHEAMAEYRGDDPEVLIALTQAVAKSRDWRSLPKLYELMEHPDVRVRGKAGAAVAVIMGADYYFRADDPPDKRRESLDRIRSIHQSMIRGLKRSYGDQ